MALEPSFQVRLDIYEIDADVRALRPKIWAMLGPRLVAFLHRHVDKVQARVPHYTLLFAKSGDQLTALNFEYTKRLFLNDFDENWVQDAYDRARCESEFGLDMRSRGAIWQSILHEFSKVVRRKYWFSTATAVRLLDATTRLMILDVANAVVCHNAAEVKRAKARGIELASAIEEFSRTAQSLRAGVGAAMELMKKMSDDLDKFSSTALSEVNSGVRAAADTASRVEKIASATEELTASIGLIRSFAGESASKAYQAVSQTDKGNNTVRALSDAVETIGSVTGMISSVASQTNLLALNATIEAAHAGNSGRGFAVVAAEVKNLATQTSQATGEIERQICFIQDQSRQSVEQIQATAETVLSIAETAEKLAAMVSAQASATGEIAESSSGTADNAATLTSAFKKVEETVDSTQKVARSILDVSADLSIRTREIGAAIDKLVAVAAHGQAKTHLADLSDTHPVRTAGIFG
jgi:methyl-accepting chemotaxis protein